MYDPFVKSVTAGRDSVQTCPPPPTHSCTVSRFKHTVSVTHNIFTLYKLVFSNQRENHIYICVTLLLPFSKIYSGGPQGAPSSGILMKATQNKQTKLEPDLLMRKHFQWMTVHTPLIPGAFLPIIPGSPASLLSCLEALPSGGTNPTISLHKASELLSPPDHLGNIQITSVSLGYI